MARPPQEQPRQRPLQRDQQRALHAYASVADVSVTELGDYKIAVNALGANILRSGLAGAMAVLERASPAANGAQHSVAPPTTREAAVMKLRRHLANAGISGLPDKLTEASLPHEIRKLEIDSYILATRETLQVVLWLRRAVQARKA